ncbi:aspartyl protease family protein [Lacunisphaera limnophila]|uniref:aspartyl protease family protein n=1 Tax=Lacunisphaera limnophila TaxID=1838286 RepID=UPI0012FE2C03|nr:aspartyl protease family protein [Lacunisphaera limnophila]
MKFQISNRPAAAGSRRLFFLLTSAFILLFASGCLSRGRSPGSTRVEPQPVRLPAKILSNFFLVESRQPDGKTYRFMVDTGSSVTLVSPALADVLRQKERRGTLPRTLPVRGANGREVALPAITLRQLQLGEAYFERVPAIVYDFTEFSAHVGQPIDGIVGFSLFRDTLLTLDYPAAQLEIAPNPALAPAAPRPPRTSVVPYNREQPTPFIPVQMGNESFFALVDTGSDLGLSLNPAGLHPRFTHGPRVGLIVGSLDGNQRQLVGRLEQNITIGTQLVHQPVVDLTENLSSLGGELLRHFRLTFDQQRHTVTLVRTTDGPVELPGRRSTGLSFRRFPNYWRLLAVVPDTPNSSLPVQPGDLCVRINGELVEHWTLERYTQLVNTAPKITFTFLSGPKETDHEVPVFELVP